LDTSTQRATARLRELHTLLASTSNIPSDPSSEKQQSWNESQLQLQAFAQHTTVMDQLQIEYHRQTALAITHLTTSPTPIGLTLQFFSKAINLQAKSGEIIDGSTKEVQRCFANIVMKLQSSLEVDLKQAQNFTTHTHLTLKSLNTCSMQSSRMNHGAIQGLKNDRMINKIRIRISN